jgi:hypothetical protein
VAQLSRLTDGPAACQELACFALTGARNNQKGAAVMPPLAPLFSLFLHDSYCFFVGGDAMVEDDGVVVDAPDDACLAIILSLIPS